MICKRTIDVAVIGGGPAGVAAAYASGGAGASVLLIESSGHLGGSVSAAMHRSICGLYADEPAQASETLNAGAQRSLVVRMMKKAPGAVQPRQYGKAWVLEFPQAAWELSLMEMTVEAGAETSMHSRVTRVRRELGRVAALQVDDGDWIQTGAVIDCTGGALLQMMGEDVMLPQEAARMLGGYSVLLGDLAGDVEMLRLQVPYALRMAVEKGILPAMARFSVFYPGAGPGEGVCKLAVRPADFATDAAEKMADAVVDYLKHEISGFGRAVVLEKSLRALPRDGRRLRGKVTMMEEDVLLARKHGGGAARGWWPMEQWDAAEGPTYIYPPAGEYYDIPDAALSSAVVENLFAAGRCVSATAGAAASIRASGICLATGDAAGRLAAMHSGAAAKVGA